MYMRQQRLRPRTPRFIELARRGEPNGDACTPAARVRQSAALSLHAACSCATMACFAARVAAASVAATLPLLRRRCCAACCARADSRLLRAAAALSAAAVAAAK